ncbi:MAG TPA: DMT family transporter [Candidatus Hydrogenedentes bacterium]|nr:DMT family transporter [Candidatus Hydrogenedentota bacterium]
MRDSSKTVAGLILFLAMVSWAQAPVFIRFLREAYEPFSMAFIRYSSGALALTVVSLLFYRSEFLRLLRDPRPVLGIAVLNTFQQWTWTAGCYGSTATMAQVFNMLSLVFVVIFSFMLFHEERAVIRSPLFAAGSSLCFLGAVAVLTKDPNSLRPVFDRSSLLLLITAVSWGVYRVWSKHIVMTWHPIPMFTVLAWLTSAGFLALTFAVGRPSDLVNAGGWLTFVALFSGIMPIAVAHPSFNYAQRNLGSAFCTSVGNLTPLLTYLFAIVMLNDEFLRLSQWLGAFVLIGGAFLVNLAGRRVQNGQAAADMPPVEAATADSGPGRAR